MHYYLTSPVQQSRPDGLSWSPPIDIRGDWSTLDLAPKLMVVASDHQHPDRRLTYLGDSLDGRSRWLRRRLGSRLGVDLEADTLRGALVELLLLHPTRWRRLQAEPDGWYRIYLRGLIYETPPVVGTVHTEDFTRGADENLEASANWTLVAGTAGTYRVIASTDDCDMNVVNSAASYRYGSDTSTSNAYCQLDLTVMTIPTGDPWYNQVGPAVSFSGSANTFAFFMRQLYDDGGGDTSTYNLRKSVAGSRSDLTSETTQALSLPEELKISRSGANLKGYIDGTEKDAYTMVSPGDDDVPATAKGGLYGFYQTGGTQTVDNWEFGDYAGGPFTVRPDGDGTVTSVVNETSQTSNLYQSIDDDPDSPNTSDYNFTKGADGDAFYDLSLTPGDFSAVESPVTVRADVRKFNVSGSTITVYAQIFAANESDTYTNEGTLADESTADGLASVALTVNATGLAASKADWDAARIRIRWDYT